MVSLQLLILQVATIVVVSRVIGWLFRRLQQPHVVGEMVAGILLGPSLLGWLAPRISAALFPTDSLGNLNALSQIGLLLFMFLVGLELDLKHLKDLGRAAVITSQVSIVLPFALGLVLAHSLYLEFSSPNVSFYGFALFMGAAMSITAFPVLARILRERNMLGSRVGAIAIGCAAVDDVTAWCLLAVIMVVVHSTGSGPPLWLMLAGVLVFVAAMLLLVRPLLRKLGTRFDKGKGLTHETVAVILLVVLGAGWVTESLGIHALFGAFLAGVAMPRHEEMTRMLLQTFEGLIVVLLLPLYFAFTGLRSSFLLINSSTMWLYCGAIVLFAVAGKLGGSMISARLNGMTWRESSAVGILMNTRGLFELVVLNIGLDLGILSRELFSIMVFMAVFTTLMTTPLLNLVYRDARSQGRS
jgi:Kef-type K+ transport system membrane component KefB